MKVIADLQIHSKYSRACSQDLNPRSIGLWADKKGIKVIGTGDFTHPLWLAELKDNLEETKPGLYQLKDKNEQGPSTSRYRSGAGHAYFLLSAEVSSIYKQGDKVRRIHNMILAPNFAAVDKIVAGLEKVGANLKSDGRPIMGVKCPDLVKIVLEADEKNVVIPAHVWTPHFGLFGSLSGFDSIDEAFGDQAKHIFAVETGLSSDPRMNWQVSSLDKYTLVSNSDAHSLRKLGREANVFQIDESKLSYDEIMRVIKNKNPREFLFTIEFFPEEGKYHLDGHADCKFSCLPEETKKYGGTCPKCGKKLLVGVLSRVQGLGDRAYGSQPKKTIPFKSVIPLEEIIAEVFDSGISKKVLTVYENMVSKINEFEILLDLPREEIAEISNEYIAEAVMRVRQGKVHVEGGYDGVFGTIHIYSEGDREKLTKKTIQGNLF